MAYNDYFINLSKQEYFESKVVMDEFYRWSYEDASQVTNYLHNNTGDTIILLAEPDFVDFSATRDLIYLPKQLKDLNYPDSFWIDMRYFDIWRE